MLTTKDIEGIFKSIVRDAIKDDMNGEEAVYMMTLAIQALREDGVDQSLIAAGYDAAEKWMYDSDECITLFCGG